MFNKRVGVFYRVLNHEKKPRDFRPNKTQPASLLNYFKNEQPQKGSNCERRTLAYKKNKVYALLVLCIILLFRFLMRSVLAAFKAHARDVLSVT